MLQKSYLETQFAIEEKLVLTSAYLPHGTDPRVVFGDINTCTELQIRI